MPFLRFSRDRRGYESTYLCHTFRRGGTSQLRVLYWFRSPPDVKVGRLALDPGAIRAIEESNPDLKFDWSKILKVTPPPLPPDHGRDGREERRARRRRGRDTDTASTPSALNAIPAGDQAETPESAVAVESEREPDHLDPATHRPEPASGVWADLDPNGESDTQAEGPPAHVVLGLTDEQGLARLRARHAEIQARIGDRVREPATLEQLLAQASLLDPDAWRSVDEARERLASLEENATAIRKVLGRRRRTRRGGARRRRRHEADGGRAAASTERETQGVPETSEAPDAPAPTAGLAVEELDS